MAKITSSASNSRPTGAVDIGAYPVIGASPATTAPPATTGTLHWQFAANAYLLETATPTTKPATTAPLPTPGTICQKYSLYHPLAYIIATAPPTTKPATTAPPPTTTAPTPVPTGA